MSSPVPPPRIRAEGRARAGSGAILVRPPLERGPASRVPARRSVIPTRGVAAAGEDEFLRLYDLTEGRLVEERAAHRDWIRALAFADNHLVSGSGDKTIAVWRVSGSRLLPVRRIETPSRVRSVQVSAQSDLILAAGEDAAISAYMAKAVAKEEA